jgi:DNA-binding transcriptional ArsR family regulator
MNGSSDEVAEVFRTLGMARRLQIMQLFLHVSDTLCGCEIADILELEDYQVSRDLSALKKAGLVESHGRTGTWIHYQAAGEPNPTVRQLPETIEQLPVAPHIERRLTMRLGFREQAGCVLGVGDPDVLAALDQATGAQRLNVLD